MTQGILPTIRNSSRSAKIEQMKSYFRSGLLLLLSVILSGCSTVGLFVLNSSLKVGADHALTSDIQYGERSWQKLDIYTPSGAAEKQNDLPVLVFFYGGGWDSGHKEMYYFVANAFVKRGYVVVIPDYLKYPQARFPDFIEDGAAAIDWVSKNIQNYGGNQQKIVAAGHSAGAHLGALLVSDARYLAQYDRTPNVVRAFVGLAGPYNFTPESKKLIEVFGPPERFPQMQINTFIDGDEPSILLLHGAEDSTVSVLNQESMLSALAAAGNPGRGIVYPDIGHVKIVLSLTPPLLGSATTLNDMDEFFRATLNDL